MRWGTWLAVGAVCSALLGCRVTQSETPDGGGSVTPGARTLNVQLAGSGAVTSSPAGIDCGSTCTASFADGTQVQLTATPASGWSFSGFSGACTGAACTVAMGSDLSVTATFTRNAAPTHVLTVMVQGRGTVTSAPAGISCGQACTASFDEGTQVQLSATPSAGWTFSGFSGACTGSTCAVNLSTEQVVSATFTEIPPPPPPGMHTLTVAVLGQGVVTSSPGGIACAPACTATFNEGAQVQLSATPASGWTFAGFSGACTGASCAVTLSGDLTVLATFTEIPPPPVKHLLTVAVQGQGTVTSTPAGISCAPSCTASFDEGTAVQLSTAPASGWTFSGFSGACSGSSCAVVMAGDLTVTATFTENPPVTHQLTVTVQGHGTVTSTPAGISCGSTCTASFNHGTQVQLTAAPDAGFIFGGFSGACSGMTCNLTLSSDLAVVATFAASPPAHCEGLAPGPLPAPVIYQTTYSNTDALYCSGMPIGDGNGFVARPALTSGHPQYTILSPSGAVTGTFSFWHGEAWSAPLGFVGYGGSSMQQFVAVNGYDEQGHPVDHTYVNGSAVFAADPLGGLLAVGKFSPGSAPTPPPAHPVVQMFNASGSNRYGPVDLGSDATVFGLGVDLLGRAVVILDGSPSFGPGSIAAKWFSATGVPLTGVFQILAGFVPGASTWFETSPLLGGGLALRRMDTPGGELRTSEWLLVLPSGAASTQPAPAWLTSRPNTKMQLVKSGQAYGFSPWATDVATCAQQVEIVSSSGTSCGTATFPVDSNPCTTRELRIGLDGTVMQMLPASREQNQPPGSPVYTCTLRYWPAALH